MGLCALTHTFLVAPAVTALMFFDSWLRRTTRWKRALLAHRNSPYLGARVVKRSITSSVPVSEWLLWACSTVDFGPGWYNLSYAFGKQQALMNAPGKRAPLNSEY